MQCTKNREFSTQIKCMVPGTFASDKTLFPLLWIRSWGCKFVWLYGNSLVKFKFDWRLTKIPKFLWGLNYGYHVTVIWKSGSLRTFQTHLFQSVKHMSSVCQVAVMLVYYKYCSKNILLDILMILQSFVPEYGGLNMHWWGGRGSNKQRHTSLHPIGKCG